MENRTKIRRLLCKTDLWIYLYAGILLLMNFIRIFDNSLWGDEYYSIRLARMDMDSLFRTTAGDVHPPLYYILVKILYRLLGDNSVIYHFSGFLPYALMIAVACLWGKKRVGWISTFIMITMSSLMPIAVVENVEVRMYSLAAFCVLVSYISLYEIINRNKFFEWITFCMFSLGAAYSHYYALISVAFFYMALILLSIKKSEYRWKTGIACIVTVIGYLPWFFKLLLTFKRTSSNWWLNYIPSVGECIRYLFEYKWLYIVFFIVLLFFTLYQLRILKLKTDEEKNKCEFMIDVKSLKKVNISEEMIWVMCGVLSIFGTMVVGLGVSHVFRPLFQAKYCFPISPVAYLILGFCISKLNYRRTFFLIFIATLFISTLPDYISKYQADKALDNDTAVLLKTVMPSSNALIYTNIPSYGLFDYYYPKAQTTYGDGYVEALREQNEIWIFWTEKIEINEEAEKYGYSAIKYYEGRFPNGLYCYVYRILKDN